MQWAETLVAYAQELLGEEQREALWMRGASDEQIDLFRIGYLDTRLPELADADDFLEWCWKGRKLDDVFVFPLTNTLGQVKGFQFRHVERERTGYMDFIPHEDEIVMFGLGQAMPHVWEVGSIWTVEGTFDMFPVHRVFPNVVATLTARITAPFVSVLRRLEPEVWLGYDMDDAGRNGCEKFVRFHGHEFRTHTVAWPRVKVGGERSKDPNEVWEAWGDARFGVFLRRQQDPYYQG